MLIISSDVAAIEDGCCDDRIAEDRSPLATTLVRGEDGGTSFVWCADQLEDMVTLRSSIIERQVTHIIDDQYLGSDVDADAAVQNTLRDKSDRGR